MRRLRVCDVKDVVDHFASVDHCRCHWILALATSFVASQQRAPMFAMVLSNVQQTIETKNTITTKICCRIFSLYKTKKNKTKQKQKQKQKQKTKKEEKMG